MLISLNDIPEDGKSYVYTRETGELNEILADLIQNENYIVDLFIRPLNSKNYELTGKLLSAAPEMCSRCGLDFMLNLNLRFKEILMPKNHDDRKAKYAKVNHISDATETDLSTAEYHPDGKFDLGEYVHEQVAISIPFNPAPQQNDQGDCNECGENIINKNFGYDEEIPEQRENPFEALKGLKI